MSTTPGRVRAYLATSVDGFIAGPEDEIGWLQEPRNTGVPLAVEPWVDHVPDGLTYDEFVQDVGCLLMGRRTFDVACGFGTWPYGEVPVLVATRRPLSQSEGAVTAVEGDIEDLIDAAHDVADGKDVYIDGGALIRQALEVGALDELVVTVIPTVLGGGVRLFEVPMPRIDLAVSDVRKYGGGFVQLHLKAR
ncbi:dihydrofolate reductase family protein [Demequina capsici]|uniref:Dihydrofolate reductase family protein n=1 Tax=Demequina capsici TaxID=3075620 RepID=A0AA96JB22_9MICO|nr:MULTISPECIES: dihydrofolate reductase family protein [unclassified Demequina]WNM25321.1 dihydrofolate reductase family protein [Demequina sp. OYTSA14]WNM28206.1 dihydrofolate reductase family protein [Demequina sp. PMTSA13]